MAENYEVIKGFQTKQGLGRYDYDYLHNKPDLATQEQAGLLSPEDKVRIDQIEEIKQAVDEIDYPVDSVNGKIGKVELTKDDIGLDHVENKSSEEIRNEITKENVTGALGYTPPTAGEVNEAVQSANKAAQAAQTTADKALQGVATAQNAITETREVAEDAHERIDDLGLQTVQGEIITLSDSGEAPLQNLVLYGKTAQKTYSGKNLLKNNILKDGITFNGVTLKQNADGSIVFNGTATADTYYGFGTAKLTEQVEYVLSGSTDTTYKFGLYLNSSDFTGNNWNRESPVVFKPTKSAEFTISVHFKQGYVMSNMVVYPMIRLASITDATYEPYTGGMPSPNPDYPQELESVGDDGSINVSVVSKNLADMSKVEIGKAWNGNSASSRAVLHINVMPGKSYTISFDSLASIESMHYFTKESASDTVAMNPSGQLIKEMTVTMPNNGYALCIQFNKEGITQIDVDAIKLQVEQGSTVSEYEPYKEQTASIPTPNGLPGIPVSSGGNYTDENGQQWVCDEVDAGRGVRVQRILRVTDVMQYHTTFESPVNGYTEAVIRIKTPLLSQYSMCSHFPKKTTKDSEYYAALADGTIYVKLKGEYTAEAWKEKWAALSPTILVCLATPIETPLSAAELAAYAALHTNYPNTIVYNDECAGMSITYSSPNTALPISGGRMAGSIDMNNNSLIGLAQPQEDNDAATKTYVDKLVENIDLSDYPTKTELEELISGFSGFVAQNEPPENIEALWIDTDDETAVAPIDADFLGGIPADDYATEDYVQTEIAKAQIEGGDVDFPVDSVNGKTGAVQLSAADVGAAVGTTILTSGADLNKIRDSGMYRLMGTHTNMPDGAAHGQLLVIHGGGDTIAQVVFKYTTAEMWVRTASGFSTTSDGTWTSWRHVYTDGFKPTPADIGAVPTSRTVNGKALSSNISLSASDVGARPSNWTPTAADVGAVPTSRTVNGKALSSNITLSASDVGARPSNWMPTAANVGATPSSHTHSKSQITDFPTSMPASDVYAWAKASSKPSYSYSEVGAAPSSHNHNAGNITSGVLPIARGGTESSNPTDARNNLGLSSFRTYYFEAGSMLDALKNNYGSMENGTCLVYARTGYSWVGVVGYKADNYAAFLELWYGDGSLYKYWNANGTWNQGYYARG